MNDQNITVKLYRNGPNRILAIIPWKDDLYFQGDGMNAMDALGSALNAYGLERLGIKLAIEPDPYPPKLTPIVRKDGDMTDNEYALLECAIKTLSAENQELYRRFVKNVEDRRGTPEIRRLKMIIERDRSNYAAGLNAIAREIESRGSMAASRGSYEWDDDRYRKEFSEALEAISKVRDQTFQDSHAFDLTDCPTNSADVKDAKRGIVSRAHEPLKFTASALNIVTAASDMSAGALEVGARAEANAICPDCGRMKARVWSEMIKGHCPKWFAIRDPEAAQDCKDHAPPAINPDEPTDAQKGSATAMAEDIGPAVADESLVEAMVDPAELAREAASGVNDAPIEPRISQHVGDGLPEYGATSELKRSEVLVFDGGDLTINISGYGNRNGCAKILMKDEELEYSDDSDQIRVLKIDASEVDSIRDFLNKIAHDHKIKTIVQEGVIYQNAGNVQFRHVYKFEGGKWLCGDVIDENWWEDNVQPQTRVEQVEAGMLIPRKN